MAQSVEPQIADLAHGWLKQYGLKYYREQDAPNSEIKNALLEYESKQGGTGGNRPDCNLLLQDSRGVYWPILIEYKGQKGKLVKLDADGQIANRNTKGQPEYKNISQFAVNGAVHYANALLHYTTYEHIIAIGMTGYRDSATEELHHEIGVYYVGKNNLGIGQRVDEFTDLSFLAPQFFESFVDKVRNLILSPDELEKLKQRREQEMSVSLVKLNNDIFKDEDGISEKDRVYLVAATIISTLGIPSKVKPLEKSDLISSDEYGQRDGDKIILKIKNFLADEKKEIPTDKQELIVNTLKNTLLNDNINRAEKGESQLRRIFVKIYDDLGIYYKIGITTDFAGRLFNEMYRWLGYTQDKLNDVVLTPSYVATLMARLARVNRNSFVWDFATGSAGLLVAAMNEMLADARANIHSPQELIIKEAEIKAKQLLGLEILPDIYMLAIINMILMGDGRSNILNQDSLKGYKGNYLYTDKNKSFPATAFVLNPPYSKPGNGMIFVERALSMMDHGYAAVIIQNSAGSGKAADFNRRILQHSSLLASIKMPLDLFIGRSSVQTHIYVFRVGEPHNAEDIVRFIDFSNDGYKRANRGKAKNPQTNLQDTGTAQQRYNEVVQLVRNGKKALHYLQPEEFYEGFIDPKNGSDWNQSAPINTCPSLEDLHRTVTEHLAWEVSNLIKHSIGREENLSDDSFKVMRWQEFRIGDLFERISTKKLSYKAKDLPKQPTESNPLPCLTSSFMNQGLNYYVPREGATILNNVISIPSNSDVYRAYYQSMDFTVLSDAYAIRWKDGKNNLTPKQYMFIVACINQVTNLPIYSYKNKLGGWNVVKDKNIALPVTGDGKPDLMAMEQLVGAIQKTAIADAAQYINQQLDNARKVTSQK